MKLGPCVQGCSFSLNTYEDTGNVYKTTGLHQVSKNKIMEKPLTLTLKDFTWGKNSSIQKITLRAV
jgi:hypothetical protein